MGPDRAAQSPGTEAILSATLGILRTRGPAAVNMEAVAAEAGVAKTTLYRRYDNRTQLLEAAILSVVLNPVPPTETSIEDQLRWVIGQTHDGVANILGSGGVSAILANQDPQFMMLTRGMLVPWVELVQGVLARGVAAGTLRADVDIDVALHFILSSSLGEFVRTGTMSPDWSERVFAMLWVSVKAI